MEGGKVSSQARRDDSVWCLVMFDLPVTTNQQRKAATRFRNSLLDDGFSMVQFSVYVRYLPLGAQLHRVAKSIKLRLPPNGEVRIVPLSDRQWSTAFRFRNGTEQSTEKTPDQLLIS